MKALVTGGGGFIGSHIVERLLSDGHEVRILDNFSNGRRENIAPFLDHAELLEGDLRDVIAVDRATKNIDGVFHLGALGSVPRSIADPKTSFEVNAVGTLNVLNAAKDNGCRRVVYASSSSVYGNTPGLPRVETMTTMPVSPYAVSKLSAEQMCTVFTQVYGLETVALRYFNVFGPRQSPESQYAAVIPKFLHALLSGARPVMYGDGEQSRDFTYVENVVDANLKAMAAPAASGKVMNIATGRTVSLNEMLQQLAELLQVEALPIHDAPRLGDVRDSLAKFDLATELIGYQPTVLFAEGLRRTVEAAQRSSARIESS